MNKILLKLKSIFFGHFIRDDNLIVVVSAHNTFTGNCKYAVMEIKKKFPDKKIIWFVKDKNQEKDIKRKIDVQTGIKLSKYYYNSVSKAKYIISDGSFHGGWFANGSVQIDFWHGMPVIYTAFDEIEDEPSMGWKIRNWINKKNWILSCTSEYNAKIMSSATRLPMNMIKIWGQPYVTTLVDKNRLLQEISKDNKLSKFYKQTESFEKIFLYTPTNRLNGDDFFARLSFDADLLNKVCKEKNILFLIKTHPFYKFKLDRKYTNIIEIDKSYDLYSFMAISDVIITDYSSVYFQSLITNNKIVLMQGDKEYYINECKNIYESEIKNMQGHIIDDFNDLCHLIEKGKKIKPVPQKLIDKYWDKEILKNPYKFMEVFDEK